MWDDTAGRWQDLQWTAKKPTFRALLRDDTMNVIYFI